MFKATQTQAHLQQVFVLKYVSLYSFLQQRDFNLSEEEKKRTILLGKVEKEQKEVEIVLLLKKRSKNGRSSSENKNEFGSFWENTSS